MITYSAPIEDMRFVSRELLAAEASESLPGLEDFTADIEAAILAEAAKLSEEVLFPLNRSGDEQGCQFDNGIVRTPDGFKQAFARYAEGGWTGLGADPAYGGQGVPERIATHVVEMMCSANLAFSMYPALTHGAYHAVHAWGSDAQKQCYLPHLIDGSWTGTMCLTEPQCGTDLGLIRTRADLQDDGTYRVRGIKIFISAGDHDLAENIVHLVLARTPNAPPGIKGISLFLVPKFIPAANGDGIGERNNVRTTRIEHKMGIKASATCELEFDGATGYLIGELNKGMRGMFTMMNAARLVVGVQGLGIAEASRQGASAYARERRQGRALGGASDQHASADPIHRHPDVRRMLLTLRAHAEGGRALAAWVAHAQDVAMRHEDANRRQQANDFVSLLIPVVKAYLTDIGSECANIGIQVFGGHGYITDNGMEQYVRDARICQIYEGTNGIQALDLVARKLPSHTGRALRQFFHPLDQFIRDHRDDPSMSAFIDPLAKAFLRLQRATAVIAQRGLSDPREAAGVAGDYLRLFALVATAYLWARAAKAAMSGGECSASFYRAKLRTAHFFFERLLPHSSAHFAVIMAGYKVMGEFEDEAL